MKILIIRLIACGMMLIMAACAPSVPLTEPSVRAQVPTAIISTPSVEPSVQPDVPTATISVTTQTQPEVASEIDTMLKDLVEAGMFSGSVLVARDDEILLSEGYGLADRDENIPNTPETRFRLGSVTKQFTAMAIMILQAQGKLDVNDSICTHLTDCPEAWQAITLHHLLTHTSGIPNFTEFSDYLLTKATPTSPEETIVRFIDKDLDFQPGAQWRYSNSNYILLGYVIEQVSNESYDTFLQRNIFEPLQMRDTGYDHNDSSLATGYANRSTEASFIDMSIPFAAGGLYSTVEDLYRWDQALNTEQLASRDLLKLIFSPHSPTDIDTSYGYGWEIGELNNHQVIFHGGNIEGFAAEIRRYLDDKVTIIVLSNQQDLLVNKITDSIAALVFGEK